MIARWRAFQHQRRLRAAWLALEHAEQTLYEAGGRSSDEGQRYLRDGVAQAEADIKHLEEARS